MSVEAFSARKPINCACRSSQLGLCISNNARAFQKVIYAERRRETRRSSRRQNVVSPGEIIAYRFRRIRADEDRARVVDPGGCGFVVFGDDLDVFGGDSVGERAGGLKRF